MASRMGMLQRHGVAPYGVALLHGGPGAVGSLALVARRMAAWRGVLEPWQSAETVDGTIEETLAALTAWGRPPLTLVGHSWGAWLALLVAAGAPSVVGKVILVGCGPLRAADAADIMARRLARLGQADQQRVHDLWRVLAEAKGPDKGPALARFGALLARADLYCPLESAQAETSSCDERVFTGVWGEASALRQSGELLRRAARVACPVVAVHGRYDPHPWQGVAEPLAACLSSFRLLLLEKCGHTPWLERWAGQEFFRILKEETS